MAGDPVEHLALLWIGRQVTDQSSLGGFFS